MDIGDTVLTPSGLGTIKQLPRSVGRKRPRVLVATTQGDLWFHVDELKEAPVEAKP